MGICIDFISDFTVTLVHMGEMGEHGIVEVLPFMKEILQMVSLSSSSISCRFGISSSLTTLLTCHPSFLFGKEGHSPLKCPAFQQWKYNPFLM